MRSSSGASLLSDDPLVLAALRGDAPTASARSVQRHFSQVTGLTEKRIRQIVRARKAAELLQGGASILDVTHELGYADQAHLTRDLKRLTGLHAGPDEGSRRADLRRVSFRFKTPHARTPL